MNTVNPTAVSGAFFPQSSGIDIETLLLTVQMQRANLIDQQLAAKIEGVKARNDQISKLNNVLSTLTAVNNAFPSNATGTTTFPWNTVENGKIEANANQAIKDAGITDLGFSFTDGGNCKVGSGVEKQNSARVNGGVTKGQVEAAIQKVKGMLDSANNNSQMDMLELQSLTNKRNDAYDLMTNFIKKMADSRASILANLR